VVATISDTLPFARQAVAEIGAAVQKWARRT